MVPGDAQNRGVELWAGHDIEGVPPQRRLDCERHVRRPSVVASGEHVRGILIDTLPWVEGNFEFLEKQLSEAIDSANLRLDPQALILDIYRQLDEEEAEGGPDGTDGPDKKASPADDDAQVPSTTFLAEGLRLAIVDALLRDDLSVPLLPTVVNKLLEITRREDYSLQDLSDVIMADQVIAGQVLKQANSAFYGSSSEIDSLPQFTEQNLSSFGPHRNWLSGMPGLKSLVQS